MISHIKVINTGPISNLDLYFKNRLNIITGDNGLGKSFILDILWWIMTRTWPIEINNNIFTGMKALPANKKEKAQIYYSFSATSSNLEGFSEFKSKQQIWSSRKGRQGIPGFVFYAMTDGCFAVWDPIRNYWREKNETIIEERPRAYVFSSRDIWNGIIKKDESWLCNGLILDWSGWQKEKGWEFKILCELLKILSPSEEEEIYPGSLVRISLNDSRDMPTIIIKNQGQEIPIVHASSGVKRILSIAYLFVWCLSEHLKNVKLTGCNVERKITFLIDEIELHLHPKWQCKILQLLLESISLFQENLTIDTPKISQTNNYNNIQIIASTHSPFIMSSLEDFFDSNKDAWFDINSQNNKITIKEFRDTRQDALTGEEYTDGQLISEKLQEIRGGRKGLQEESDEERSRKGKEIRGGAK